jgi:hypothetical protein
MRRVALLTLLFFGCATSRPPSMLSLPLAGPAPQRVALAEPELELWLEGTQRVDPAEAARALDQGRAALAHAVEGRGLDGVDAPDALLVVRVRAVSRTSDRRTAQYAAAGGIVVGFALAVALFYLWTRDLAHSSSQPPLVRAAPVPGAGVAPVVARPAPAAPFLLGWTIGVHVAVPQAAPAAAAAGPAGALPDPLLAPRDFFDGDEVELSAELVDPQTGDVRWRRALREGIDVRDAKGMRALVDRALEGAPLGQRGASKPQPEPAPAPSEPPRSPAPASAGRAAGPDFDGDL